MMLLLVLTLVQTPTPAGPRAVEYTLAMPDPASHIFHVEVTFDGLAPGDPHLDLTMPAWRPGRYAILDFAAGVIEFSAADGLGKPLAWRKTDKSTWRIETGGKRKVTASYRVYADEFPNRTRGLDETHAFVNGTAVFLHSPAHRSLPVRLKVEPPRGWHVTTGMEGKGTSFSAPDYDHFVDCPLEIGRQKDHRFSVGGKPHVLSVYGEAEYNADSLTADIAKIVETTSALWGDMPYTRYVFLLHAAPWAGGGTEHVNSTIMGVKPENLAPGDGYRRFLGLVAHEYFHTWNVKRLKPAGIVPYDYARENYVRELWIAEGTTSYYDELLPVRAGLTTPRRYLDDLAADIREDRTRPGNAIQSLTEASFDAWIRFNRGSVHSYNTETDFYTKGARVSLLLDLTIRRATGNRSSLDSVLRTMYRRFPTDGPGYTVEDFEKAASEAAGTNLARFFSEYVHGTAALPWEETLAAAGLRLAPKDTAAKPWIGLSTRESGDRLVVTRVPSGSPAAGAGLETGDEIVAVGGRKATARALEKAVAAKKKGETIELAAFRDDELREFTVKVAHQPVPEYALEQVDEPTDLQKAVYESWLSAAWE